MKRQLAELVLELGGETRLAQPAIVPDDSGIALREGLAALSQKAEADSSMVNIPGMHEIESSEGIPHSTDDTLDRITARNRHGRIGLHF